MDWLALVLFSAVLTVTAGQGYYEQNKWRQTGKLCCCLLPVFFEKSILC